MSNKTLMVAQREYLENVRTKTFWIGILIAGSIFMQKFLAKAKDLRKYAVVDHSEGQWLGKAISERANAGDLVRLFEGFKFSATADGATWAKEFADQLAAAKSHPLNLVLAAADEPTKAQVRELVLLAAKGKLR